MKKLVYLFLSLIVFASAKVAQAGAGSSRQSHKVLAPASIKFPYTGRPGDFTSETEEEQRSILKAINAIIKNFVGQLVVNEIIPRDDAIKSEIGSLESLTDEQQTKAIAIAKNLMRRIITAKKAAELTATRSSRIQEAIDNALRHFAYQALTEEIDVFKMADAVQKHLNESSHLLNKADTQTAFFDAHLILIHLSDVV